MFVVDPATGHTLPPTHRQRPRLVKAVRFDPQLRPYFLETILIDDSWYVLIERRPERIRPGDWLVTDETGTHVVSGLVFDALYEELGNAANGA